MPTGIYKRQKRKAFLYSCGNCKNNFWLMPSKKRRTNFCSRKCSDEHWAKNRKLRNGKYYAIHKWLIKHYGKADRCENPNCHKVGKKFHWALLKSKKHEHKRENYISLCSRCHFNYDITLERRRRQSKSLRRYYANKKCSITRNL